MKLPNEDEMYMELTILKKNPLPYVWNELSKRGKISFYLRYAKNLNHDEINEIMLSERDRERVEKAKKRIKQRIRKMGIEK